MAIDNITLGRGKLLFQEAGTEGYREIGNTPAFGLTINTELLKHYNSDSGVKKQDREIPIQTDYSGTFTTDNVNHKNLSMLFQGSTSTIAVAALATQTKTFVGVELDRSYVIGDRFLENVVVKIIAAVQVLNVDYTVDEERGIVTPLSTGAIVAGTDMIVEYDIKAHSVDQTVSAADIVEGSLLFLADNPEGDNIDYTLGDVKISPNGEFAIKAEEWQALQFNVAISEPVGGSAILANGQPYVVV